MATVVSPKPPDKVLVMLDWAGVERRYFFSATRAADGLLGYYLPSGNKPNSPSRALVYRLDEDASATLDALTDAEVTGHQNPKPGNAPLIWSDKKAWKQAKDAFAAKIKQIVGNLP